MQGTRETLTYLRQGLQHAEIHEKAVPNSIVQSCADFYYDALRTQMSRCAQQAATLHLLAIYCGEKDQAKAEVSCRHQASDWRQQRHHAAKLLKKPPVAPSGLQFVHAWDHIDTVASKQKHAPIEVASPGTARHIPG